MSDSTPSYERLFSSKLYVMSGGAGDAGWCAYLLGRNDTPPMEPITVEQSFMTFDGFYLFASSAPDFVDQNHVDTFSELVRQYLDSSFGNGLKFNGRACVWIPDAATPVFGDSSKYAFPFAFGLSSATLQQNLNNPIGQQITFSVQTNTVIGWDASALVLSGQQSGGIGFTTTPSNIGPSVSPNTARIPLTGPYGGCFLVGGAMNTAVTQAALGADVRYAHGGTGGAAVVQAFPLLVTATPGTNASYVGAVDPLDPFNTTAAADPDNGRLRTLLAVTGSVSLPSWFRTATNRNVSLVAHGGGDSVAGPAAFAGAFVFQSAQPMLSGQPPVYMTLAGDFALEVAGAPLDGPGAGAAFSLLCGLFGTETMTFRAYATDADFDRLRFTPGQAAYAPVFPFATAAIENPQSGAVGARLTADYLTSWAMMVDGPSGAVQYVAQPEGSPLYAAAAGAGAGDDAPTVLGSFQPGTSLQYVPGFAVPVAPYAGLATATGGFSAGDLPLYESQILAPTRNTLIAKSVAAPLAALKAARRANPEGVTTKSATTPQGLLAEVATGGVDADYVKVTLAQSDAPAGRSPEMAFVELDTELQNLFRTNQLFAVVVNPSNLGKLMGGATAPPGEPAFENTATIAGFTFEAAIGDGASATDYRNVMIFKFGDGTVQERVANPNKWTATSDFSVVENAGDEGVALTGLSQWLQNYIAAAIDEATTRGNTLYKNFARTVTDPRWNGILVLRANVGPDDLPDQIKGLAAGIDFSRFEAHHFGANVSRVKVASDGTVTIDGPSSLFGLIDYQQPLFQQNTAAGGDPNTPLAIPADGPYGFVVLQLQALFANSALVDFRSRVQLTANELFGSKTTAAFGTAGQSAANAVVLKGSYQTQGTTATYVFEQDTPTVFTLDSNALRAATFGRVQFNTLSSDTGGASPKIRSRFLVWGALDFAELPATGGGGPFDVLSFGSPAGTAPDKLGAGLAFSNLQITLESPLETPNAVTFTFDAGGLGFDLAASAPRAGSLFPTFALQLDSFIAAPADKRPPDYGFLPVTVGVSLEGITGPWFGVVYKITMGTPGALVSGAGFESKLLLAWSPLSRASDGSYAVFTGLQLPGASPGAKLLSLQGVLKVSVSSIQLLYDTVAGSTDKAFTLKLSNIGLKFLGIAKLPPGATINFFLFGPPGGTGSLGWYAAYVEDTAKGEQLVELDAPPALDAGNPEVW